MVDHEQHIQSNNLKSLPLGLPFFILQTLRYITLHYIALYYIFLFQSFILIIKMKNMFEICLPHVKIQKVDYSTR